MIPSPNWSVVGRGCYERAVPFPIGRLRDSTLGDLLGASIRSRLDGTLVILDSDGTRRIHLRRGEVCAIEGAPPSFGDLVATEGLLTAPEIEAVLRADPSPRRVGQKLVLARRLSSPTRDALLASQRALRLEALFRLSDGEVSWCAPSPLPAGALELPPLSPSRVLHGRPRRRARVAVDADRRAALEVLGVGPEASRAEIVARYRALVLALHPDRGGDRQHRLREVLSAWRTLSATAP